MSRKTKCGFDGDRFKTGKERIDSHVDHDTDGQHETAVRKVCTGLGIVGGLSLAR